MLRKRTKETVLLIIMKLIPLIIGFHIKIKKNNFMNENYFHLLIKNHRLNSIFICLLIKIKKLRKSKNLIS